jgi:hypothetical protein
MRTSPILRAEVRCAPTVDSPSEQHCVAENRELAASALPPSCESNNSPAFTRGRSFQTTIDSSEVEGRHSFPPFPGPGKTGLRPFPGPKAKSGKVGESTLTIVKHTPV